jgi:nitroimidazol reductase NimA-like FMN-containing flavoprotein (pyridoxamine 5'-phosphate oxidase superfamily)
MTVPLSFSSDPRRTEYAWNDWDAVAAFIGDQAVCRIAVNDGTWPYVVAQTFRFVDDAFLLHFSRSGKLAAAIARDPNCTIEIDQIVSLLKAPNAENTSAEYRSVVARRTASLSLLDLDVEEQQYTVLDKYRPEKDYRILAEDGNPAGVAYARYPFPPPAALSALPPDAFRPR